MRAGPRRYVLTTTKLKTGRCSSLPGWPSIRSMVSEHRLLRSARHVGRDDGTHVRAQHRTAARRSSIARSTCHRSRPTRVCFLATIAASPRTTAESCPCLCTSSIREISRCRSLYLDSNRERRNSYRKDLQTRLTSTNARSRCGENERAAFGRREFCRAIATRRSQTARALPRHRPASLLCAQPRSSRPSRPPVAA